MFCQAVYWLNEMEEQNMSIFFVLFKIFSSLNYESLKTKVSLQILQLK